MLAHSRDRLRTTIFLGELVTNRMDLRAISRAGVAIVFTMTMSACSSIELQDSDPIRQWTSMLSEIGRLGRGSDTSGDLAASQMMSQSLQIQMQWRAESLAENVSFDPGKRPRKLPRPFVKQAWDNEIPLMADEVPAQLSSDFGWRTLNRRHDFHSGIDIVAAPGATVFTPVTGEVIHTKVSGTDSGVVIFDGERQHTFWHTVPVAGLEIGQQIDLGDAVGTLAPWGTRTHLHYSVHLTGKTKSHQARKDSNAIDPLTLVQRLRERAHALNDADGDTLNNLLRDAQHRALLIQAAREEDLAALDVPFIDVLQAAPRAEGETDAVAEAETKTPSSAASSLDAVDTTEVAIVTSVSNTAMLPATASPEIFEDEAPAESAGITFSLSRNGTFRTGSRAKDSEPEEPKESFSLEAFVSLLQSR